MTGHDSSRRQDNRMAPAEIEDQDLPLRDRKKARQRAELLRIALELFQKEGFEKTRMEDIAARALVSTPTVYNYFTTKREVLIEILMEDRRVAREAFEEVVRKPVAEPADAFAALIYANMSNIRRPEDKRLWRELLAAVAKTHDRERDSFDENHEVFKGYIKRLVQHYIETGRFSDQIPIELAADVIFAVNSQNLRTLAASRSYTPERIREMARDQIALVTTGWHRPGNISTQKAGAPRSRPARKRS
jgi:AcrR family transcriptional regulator